ncbi:MAG: hypothetical protein HKN78_02805 [Sphingomonadaceae bacterium]|nr:hypothetical protein [Sphingomonadaceae bacterium]
MLPIILFHLGVGTALIGTLTFFAQSTTFFLVAAMAFIAVGVILSFHGGRRPSRTSIILFAVATAIVIVAYALPSYEG